ncbi:MAG: hypothetical protein FD155_3113 [Bacteroidetes bacterium]|nr:MAG: hypothetical protein FD155_3113 [Bacteroidota bacterium]
MKKVVPLIIFILLFALLVTGFMFRDSFNAHIGKLMQQQNGENMNTRMVEQVDALYNYELKNESYQVTFIEFGAKCPACIRMESVMKEITTNYPGTVNVVFYDIMKAENQSVMKFYGIASIPAQVLLDRSGSEFFRHNGYISASDLLVEINKQIIN